MNLHTLSNGIRVALEALPQFRSFSIGIWVGAGCCAETLENNGISHFIEHMLFKGTSKRTSREIAGCIDALGGQLNAFTAKECTCFYVNILDEHYGVAVDLLCDMLINSSLDPEEILREQGVVCEEISMVEDTPDELIHEKLAAAFYGEHPLGKTILGTKQNVEGFDRAKIRAYMDRLYVPENIVVSVAGSFDENKIIEMLEEKLVLKPSAIKVERCPGIENAGGRVIVQKKETEQVNLCIGFNSVAQNDERMPAHLIMSNIFGGGMSSRLFQRVREQNGLTYSIYSYPALSVNSGVFTIYAGMNPAQAQKVQEFIFDEIKIIRSGGVTEREYIDGREQLKGSFILGFENVSSIMSRNGKTVLLQRQFETPQQLIEKIDSVTKRDIDEAVESVFGSKMCAAVVGKTEGNEEYIKQLREKAQE